MKASELNQHLEAAKEAALVYEEQLRIRVERTLNLTANTAARRFSEKAEDAGDAGWIMPQEEEILDASAGAKMDATIEGFRAKAIRAFTSELPRIVESPSLAAAGRRRSPPPDLRVNWDVSSPFIAPALERTGEQIATITQTTRAQVMRAIKNGYEQGLSIPDTADLIRATVRGASAGRAATIARTEMARLVNGAQVAATQTVGAIAEIDYYKKWLTAPGAEYPRHEDYEGLDGQTVPVDALFDVGGEQLEYPGDPGGTPENTCNCRCSLEMVEAQGAIAAAGLPFDDTTLEENVETAEQLADEPMKGTCANCDHAASDHAGEMNDGACSVDECSCQGMETAAEAETASVDVEITPDVSQFPQTIVFTTSAGSATYATTASFQNGWANVVQPAGDTVPVTIEFENVTLPPELQPSEELPDANPSPEAPVADLGTEASFVRWTAIFAPEGKATDDGRIFAPGSIGWRQLPLSLMAMTETPGEGGHAGAELCGRIDNIYRDESATPIFIRAAGVFNDDETGRKIVQLVDDGFLTGNSVDLAVSGSKVVLRVAVVDDEGFWLEGVNIDDVPEVDIFDVMMGEVSFDDILFVITEAKIGMSTVCPFPAFAEATISLAAGGERRWASIQGWFPQLQTVTMDAVFKVVHSDDGMTASAAGLAPIVPPAEWFDDPGLDKLTPLTVTPEGKVFGHAFPWGECHIGIQDECTIAPHSGTGYAYYLLKEVETVDGSVECGTITLDTNHASKHLSWRDAASHYDHTGTAIADVMFGEDEHGGWFSGALRPDASAEAVRKFRGASVSGDWRRIHGSLELVGLLTVNVPGFPIPRTKALVAAAEDGFQVLALIAAGVQGGSLTMDVTEAGKTELALLAEQARGGLDDLAALADSARV